MTELYKNAICLPCHGAENRALIAGYATGGVVNQHHEPIDAAVLIRQYRKNAIIQDGSWDNKSGNEVVTSVMILPRTVETVTQSLYGKYIFAGYLFPHYGHFILESLSRLWFIKRHPEIPLVWLGVHNQIEFTDMHRQIFDIYDIKNPMFLLTEATKIEELFVPEAGYIISTRYTKSQIDALRLVGSKPVVPGKKIWLSRSKLDKGRLLNEKYFEQLLALRGWKVFHPEHYSIVEQVDFLCDSEVIAGIEGSGFHTLIFMPEYAGKVSIFVRGASVVFDYLIDLFPVITT